METPIVTPPKPGSVKEEFHKALDKKASGGTQPEPKADAKPDKPTEKPAAKTEAKPSDEQLAKGKVGDKPSPEDSKNPWRLKEFYEKKWQDSERQLAELRSNGGISQEQIKQIAEREATYKKRIDDLEGEMRYVNYSKSADFQEKYAKPYQKAWQVAMANLAEIPVMDAQGNAHALQPQDILRLVNLSLPQAKQLATEMFGDFSTDVLTEVKEIKKLWESQSAALEDARKTAGERDQQRQQQWQAHTAALRTEITEGWKAANERALKHEKYGKYFAPIEGDEEGNATLQKGFALVDEAFASNPLDPRLTVEQRGLAIKKQAAIRHRAAAFGRLVKQLQKRDARIAELEKELGEYSKTDPTTEGRTEAATVPTGTSARAAVMSAIDAKAKPSFS